MEETKMCLRSSITLEQREKDKQKQLTDKLEKQNRPYIVYKGKIKYFTANYDCAAVCDNILQLINKTEDLFIIGFDLEWPFSFQNGPGKTATIQISYNLNECFVLQISQFKKLPMALTEVLLHPKVRLVGINIKNDIQKLSRDFPGIKTNLVLNNCIDLGVYANNIMPFKQRWSMEKLVDYFLKMKINKDKKIRMSKWHIYPLSTEQLNYAAIDAYASLKLYLHLKDVEINNKN